MRVNQNSYSAQCVSLPKIIKRGLPDPSRSSRLIIANSKERLEEVTNAIEQENLMAIQLEPIDTLETNS